MHGVADGATGKLMGDQVVPHQLLIQRFRHIVFDNQRVPGAQPVTRDKRIVHFCFDIHQRLIDTHHPGGVGLIFRLNLLQQRVAGVNGKVVFGFAFTGKFHVQGYE